MVVLPLRVWKKSASLGGRKEKARAWLWSLESWTLGTGAK